MKRERKKSRKKDRKMGILAALCLGLCLGLFWAGERPVCAAPAGLVSAFVQMPGFVLEQWNRVRPMAVYRNAKVYVQPDKGTAVLGSVKKGQGVNAWGQTDTGWYFIEYGDKLGYVRYEAAAFTDDAGQPPAGGEPQAASAVPAASAQAVPSAQTASAASAQAVPAATASAASAQAVPAAQVTPAAAPVIFIGDSRMVTLQDCLERNLGVCPVAVVAQNRSRYEWFHESAIPQADRIIGPGSRVVINMGVNDLGDADRYAADVNAWGAVWTARGAAVYYASVNPVWANDHGITEEAVERFNDRLRAQLIPQILWLDSNTWLLQHGVNAVDGLHYRDDTNLLLYQYYMTMIGMQ